VSAYNFKDETGNIYGYLTVLSRAENTREGRAQWLCQCKCGKTCIILGKHLRSGNTKSCGCLKKENPPARKSLINQRFGRLLVLENPRPGLRGTIWSCRCDCGKIVDKVSTDLISGNTKSCGCLKSDLHSTMNDLTNQRFGKLLAVYSTGVSKDGQRVWFCTCECGNTVEVLAGNLRKNNTSSCGCINSKGNGVVQKLLIEKGISFQTEYSFKDLLTENGFPHRFDFAIFNKQLELSFLIEYQGNIHFEYKENGWNNEDNFYKRRKRDEAKFQYCQQNNILLFYITYLDNINEKLEEILSERNL
jgi:hypothetical protein